MLGSAISMLGSHIPDPALSGVAELNSLQDEDREQKALPTVPKEGSVIDGSTYVVQSTGSGRNESWLQSSNQRRPHASPPGG